MESKIDFNKGDLACSSSTNKNTEIMDELRKRFIPKKRRALDGRVWWCVWDSKRGCWSTFTTHGRSETKSLCQSRIDSSMKPEYQEFYNRV